MIKEFRYETKEHISLQKIRDISKINKIARYISSQTGKTEDRTFNIDAYLVLPGFYTEFTPGSCFPIIAVGEESKEDEFRKNLETLTELNLSNVKLRILE